MTPGVIKICFCVISGIATESSRPIRVRRSWHQSNSKVSEYLRTARQFVCFFFLPPPPLHSDWESSKSVRSQQIFGRIFSILISARSIFDLEKVRAFPIWIFLLPAWDYSFFVFSLLIPFFLLWAGAFGVFVLISFAVWIDAFYLHVSRASASCRWLSPLSLSMRLSAKLITPDSPLLVVLIPGRYAVLQIRLSSRRLRDDSVVPAAEEARSFPSPGLPPPSSLLIWETWARFGDSRFRILARRS